MRISHKYKYIFLAKPKSASSTMRQLLDSYCDVKHTPFKKLKEKNLLGKEFYAHMPISEVQEVFKEKQWDINEYSPFVTVRNPFTRIVSVYAHVNRIQHPRFFENHNGKKQSKKSSKEPWTFKEFTKALLENNEIDLFPKYKNSKWLYYAVKDHFHFIDNNNPPPVKTFRVEDGLEPILDYLKSLGVPVPSRHLVEDRNQTDYNGKTYHDHYNDETYNIVKNYYKKEIKYFNYKF